MLEKPKKYNAGHKNLKPAQNGEVRSPNGRGKGNISYKESIKLAFKSLAYDYLEKEYQGLIKTKSKKKPKKPFTTQVINKKAEELKEAIYRKGITKAIAGEFMFYKDFMDRTHGKPVETQILETPESLMDQNDLFNIAKQLPDKKRKEFLKNIASTVDELKQKKIDEQ